MSYISAPQDEGIVVFNTLNIPSPSLPVPYQETHAHAAAIYRAYPLVALGA